MLQDLGFTTGSGWDGHGDGDGEGDRGENGNGDMGGDGDMGEDGDTGEDGDGDFAAALRDVKAEIPSPENTESLNLIWKSKPQGWKRKQQRRLGRPTAPAGVVKPVGSCRCHPWVQVRPKGGGPGILNQNGGASPASWGSGS